MKKPTTFKWTAVLCAVIVLSACQKDFENQELPETNTLNPDSFNSGVIDDDPERVAKVPVIISQDYLSNSKYQFTFQWKYSIRYGKHYGKCIG